MKQFDLTPRVWLIRATLIFLGFFSAASASAQQVLVFNHYQEIQGKAAQLSQVIDEEVSKKPAGVKGLQWAKFLYNPSTGERGSVFLWQSQADWEAYLKSDLRRELVMKVKPFLQGTVSSKSYPVYEPKR